MGQDRLLLLDTASLYFRAFFGVPDTLRAADGTPVNAVRGLLDFISRLCEVYRPTHLACCWDNDWRPQWRVELIPSYKAHRVAGAGDAVITGMAASASTAGETAPDDLAVQVPLIVAVLNSLGLAIVGHDGYEADDVIGTLSSKSWAAKSSGTRIGTIPCDVVTGDRDLFQVVDDARGVRVLYIARGVGKHERVDDAWLVAKYGIKAEHYVDFAVLRGDASDGLPGVAGVGEKTAASLISRYGGMEGILAAASEPGTSISPSVRGKLAAAMDYLAVAPEVVSVARDLDLGVTLDDLRIPAGPADPELFTELTDLLQLGSSAERVLKVFPGLSPHTSPREGGTR